MLLSLIFIISATAPTANAADRNNATPKRIESSKITIGNGSAIAWFKRSDGPGTELGIDLDRSVLENLSKDEMQEFILRLPREVREAAGVDHVGINWNPHGHDPNGIYDRAHFDFHFYRISLSERDELVDSPENETLGAAAPPKSLLPRDYVYAPKSFLPRMGAHWVDRHAPELNGSPFTATFLYGFYRGELLFFEPMVTKDFLASKQPLEMKLKQPSNPAKMPSTMRIEHSDDRITVRVTLN